MDASVSYSFAFEVSVCFDTSALSIRSVKWAFSPQASHGCPYTSATGVPLMRECFAASGRGSSTGELPG